MKKLFIILIVVLIFSCTKTESKNGDNMDIQIGDSWGVLQGENNGFPMIVRRNNWCEEILGNSNWPFRAGIAFKFQESTENGLPANSETKELNQLEDDIFDIFQKDNNSIVVIIITTSGFREYMIYTKDKNSFNQDFKTIQKKYTEYELTTYIEEDKDWTGFTSFK